MKLILREYLASLRERGELEVVLPDLLSQLGFNVFSRPGRGTRQDGVDVAAVRPAGESGEEEVYLFSIKAGNLTRSTWNGPDPQTLRPSLEEILDSYIPNRLPPEHREKKIAVCVALGGDVQEQVRPQLQGFITRHETERIRFEEWNGDKLADLIQSSFLREDLLPEQARPRLRKSLALLDEPEASYRHFAALVSSLSAAGAETGAERLKSMRQISICLWVLFAWARDEGNVEAAYLSSELALLHGWRLVSREVSGGGSLSRALEDAYVSIFSAYQEASGEFLSTNVLPYVGKRHAVSSAVRGANGLDVNLKLFDLLGRLSLAGLWRYWDASRRSEEEAEARQQSLRDTSKFMSAAMQLINNNPTLLLPVKDDHSIDVFIATTLLVLNPANHQFIQQWLTEMANRAAFAYEAHLAYPCILQSCEELLSHPKAKDSAYRKETTSASVLYPTIALWAALLGDDDTYAAVVDFKQESLKHCNFQLWYPDESSEGLFYTNEDAHGSVLTNLCEDQSAAELIECVVAECDQSSYFEDLSAIKFNWWPLVLVACRHYRLPPPPHFAKTYAGTSREVQDDGAPATGDTVETEAVTPPTGEPGLPADAQ